MSKLQGLPTSCCHTWVLLGTNDRREKYGQGIGFQYSWYDYKAVCI